MRKFKINKIVCLTLSLIVFSSISASATTIKKTTISKIYRSCELDPNPHESNPPF